MLILIKRCHFQNILVENNLTGAFAVESQSSQRLVCRSTTFKTCIVLLRSYDRQILYYKDFQYYALEVQIETIPSPQVIVEDVGKAFFSSDRSSF